MVVGVGGVNIEVIYSEIEGDGAIGLIFFMYVWAGGSVFIEQYLVVLID